VRFGNSHQLNYRCCIDKNNHLLFLISPLSDAVLNSLQCWKPTMKRLCGMLKCNPEILLTIWAKGFFGDLINFFNFPR
jgi:hypothetical protein